MKRLTLKTRCAMALLVGGIFAVGPAMADKPAWAGNDKGGDQRDDGKKERKKDHKKDRKDDDRKSKNDNDRDSSGDRRHFQQQQHVMVRDYYAEHYRGRGCPPGLAKKNNGCMPPGQAKKWRVGHPLPRDVIYYDVPSALVIQIGPPPAGHRYVRVAGDILMIAIGTGLVVDAIADLGRM
ncbi:MAG: RcnB family protein [Betaproteobacteria bacterium]|nr:RcnB family protein [Betaproteobacteria bacterium]